MTDEEMAEKILTNYLRQSASYFSRIVEQDMARDLIKVGLAEGGKEVSYMNAEEYDKYLDVCKENAELKEKMGRAGYRIAELKMQIEKMKNCRNCDKEYTNNPDCKDCKYSRKYDGKQDKWEMYVLL